MGYVDKTPASRINKAYILQWPGTGTVMSTGFQSQISHIRVISQINGYVAIEPSATAGTVGSTSTFSGYTFIAANTANGDYFSCVQGEVVTFTSTTTSSGGFVSVSEMT